METDKPDWFYFSNLVRAWQQILLLQLNQVTCEMNPGLGNGQSERKAVNFLTNLIYPLFRDGQVVDFTDSPVSSPFLLRLDSMPTAEFWAKMAVMYPFYYVYYRVAGAPIKARVVPRIKLRNGELSNEFNAAGDAYTLVRVDISDEVSATKFTGCQYQPRSYYYEKLIDSGLVQLRFSIHIPMSKPPSGDFVFSKGFEGDLGEPITGGSFVPSDYIDMQGAYFDANKPDEIWVLGKDHSFHQMTKESSYSGDFLLSLFTNAYNTQKVERGKYYVLESASIDMTTRVQAMGRVFFRGSIKVKK